MFRWNLILRAEMILEIIFIQFIKWYQTHDIWYKSRYDSWNHFYPVYGSIKLMTSGFDYLINFIPNSQLKTA